MCKSIIYGWYWEPNWSYNIILTIYCCLHIVKKNSTKSSISSISTQIRCLQRFCHFFVLSFFVFENKVEANHKYENVFTQLHRNFSSLQPLKSCISTTFKMHIRTSIYIHRATTINYTPNGTICLCVP